PREGVEGLEGGKGRLADLRMLRQVLTGTTETYPCPCFLIRHPGAGAILVDTGLHPSIASDPRHSFGRLLSRWLRPSLEPGKDVVSQLRRRGLDPAQIGTVIMTHLH